MRRRGIAAGLLIAALGCGPSDPDDESATTNAGTGAGTGAGTHGDTADASDGGDAGDGSTASNDPCAGPEPAPGCPGGLCLAPDGTCNDLTCNVELNYCYDPDDPCLGFSCGGTDRGTCSPADGLPACTCDDGFENETFALYCCPVDGGDDLCL